MSILNVTYQNRFKDNLIFDARIFQNIDPVVKLHDETMGHPLSSSASCLNVLGSLQFQPDELRQYLNTFGLNITKVLEFPMGADVGGRIYNDKGYVVFEWIGPKRSPINEVGGGRGQRRTSIDAYIIAEIDNKITQLLIEWKFTEGKSRPIALERFSGRKGLERMRRYAKVLTTLRKKDALPFAFQEERGLGLHDFAPDHLYQLLRITLLAKCTTPLRVGNIDVEDYKVVHLSHSRNDEIEILHEKHLTHSPGLTQFTGMKLYDAWMNILSYSEKSKFVGGHWDSALITLNDGFLKEYLVKRYFE